MAPGTSLQRLSFVTDTLKSKVRSVSVNTATNASDHQPILMDLRA